MPKKPKITSLQEERDEVEFFYADEHQTTLQVDIVNFYGDGQSCPNYLK